MEPFSNRVFKPALAAALFAVALVSDTAAQTAREVAQKAFPSVVLILAPQTKGKTVSLGSGFFVRHGVIATNYHVIKGSSRLYIKPLGQGESYAVGKVLSMDAKKDLALLSVDGVQAPPLSLAYSSEVQVGDEVYAIGNPEGFEGTLSQGIVSGIRQVKGREYLQITAPISHGSSGGPVLNKDGKVIGVAVGSLRVGQNLNFAVLVSDLSSLISDIETLSAPDLSRVERPRHAIRIIPKEGEVDYYEQGKRLFLRGDYVEAAEALSRAVQTKPDHWAAYLMLGNSYRRLDRHLDAIAAYKEAVRLNPTNASLRGALGNEYSILEHYQEALAELREALRLRPDDALNYQYVGEICILLRRYEEAADAFKQAVRLKPDEPSLHSSLGDAYHSLGLHEQALEAYKQAVRLKPGDAEFHCSLADGYAQLHRNDQAVDAYKEAIRLRPDYAYAHLQLGMTYLILDDMASALDEYKILKRLDPEKANKLFKQIYR